MAVDGAHIYWTTGYGIGRANLNGTGVDVQLINEGNLGFSEVKGGLAVKSGHLYWAHEKQPDEQVWIGRANVDGSGLDTTFIDPQFGRGALIQVAADSRHLYWESFRGIARANLDGTDIDHSLIPGGDRAIAVNSSHVDWGRDAKAPAIRIRRPRLHKRRGTATLPVEVLAGPGELLLRGKGLRTVTKTADFDTTLESLRVKPKGRKRHRLKRRGHVRVRARVTFTLTGADPRTRSAAFKLIMR